MENIDKIYERLQNLPDTLLQEVLDFIEYLETKHHLKTTQTPIKTTQAPTTQKTANEALSTLTGIARGSGERIGQQHDDYLYGADS